MKIALATLILTIWASGAIAGTIVQFEGFAAPGGSLNVRPDEPFSEAGLTFTPSNPTSAVFDAANAVTFPGDPTSWFGFAAGNTITVTADAPFELDSILAGPSTIGSGTTIVTFTGYFFGGGTPLSVSFYDLQTATLERFGWMDLLDFTIYATTDSAIDNVTTVIPEPATAVLLSGAAGVLAIWLFSRRRA